MDLIFLTYSNDHINKDIPAPITPPAILENKAFITGLLFIKDFSGSDNVTVWIFQYHYI